MSAQIKFTLHPIQEHGNDADPLYAILPDDGTPGFVVGEAREVRALAKRLARFVETNRDDGPVDEYDERLGRKWVTIAQARDLADGLGRQIERVTIRWACRTGRIHHAQREGRDWRMPQSAFLAWLHRGDHKPGPKSTQEIGAEKPE